jgi:hypothetical protein
MRMMRRRVEASPKREPDVSEKRESARMETVQEQSFIHLKLSLFITTFGRLCRCGLRGCFFILHRLMYALYGPVEYVVHLIAFADKQISE